MSGRQMKGRGQATRQMGALVRAGGTTKGDIGGRRGWQR